MLSDAVNALAVGAAAAKGRVSKITGAAVVGIASGPVHAQIEALQGSDEI